MTYPATDLYPSPTLYPGNGTGFGLVQRDQTTVMASWSDQLVAGATEFVLEVGTDPALETGDGQGIELMTFQTKKNQLRVRNLFPGMVWYFRLRDNLGRGYKSGHIQLNQEVQALVAGTDSWSAKTQQGYGREFTGALLRSTAASKRVLRTRTFLIAPINQVQSYRPELSVLSRTFTNLKVGWWYSVDFTLATYGNPQLPLYRVSAYAQKTTHNRLTTTKLISSNPVDISAGTYGARDLFSFQATSRTVVLSIENVATDIPLIDYSREIEALEVRNFLLAEVGANLITDDYINDVVQDGSVASYLDETLNCLPAAWWLDPAAKLKMVRLGSISKNPTIYLADVRGPGKISYTAASVSYDTEQVVNDLQITNHRTAPKALSTDDWTDETQSISVQDKGSIKELGTNSQTAEWALKDDGYKLKARAKLALARAAKTGQYIPQVVANAQESPASFLALKQFDRIYVELDGWVQDSLVRAISVNMTPTRWEVTLDLIPLDIFMASETFADFDTYEQATTFGQFDQQHPEGSFGAFDKTRSYP